jgi:hypothetical protein
MNNPSDKYTLFRRRRSQKDRIDEIVIGRSFVWLVWLILAFVLVLLGHSHSVFSFFHPP